MPGKFFDDFMMSRREKEDKLQAEFGPDFDTTARTFSLNKAEADVVDKWIKSLEPEILAIQGDKFDMVSHGVPYYGTLGGGLRYSFLPTGLGDILTVKETITGKELNVTDALDWHFFD
jgi:hypothetical protein